MKKHIAPILLCLLGVVAIASPYAVKKGKTVSVSDNPEAQSETVINPDFEIDKDPISYTKSSDAVVEYSRLKPFTRADDELVIPDKVILHYFNDDKDCLSRRFYTWVTGYDGVERKPDESDAESMKITLDFSVITEYANMPSLFFIIKKAGTWSGQSEDCELKYENYQPQIKDVGGKKVLELWTIPGEGSSIEFCVSEEETKIPKIATAKFMDWKTIHCVSSDPTLVPVDVKVYAFDRTYLKEKICRSSVSLFGLWKNNLGFILERLV